MKYLFLLLLLGVSSYCYSQVNETEPNDVITDSGIITIQPDVVHQGIGYIPPCTGDCGPPPLWDNDIWYVPYGFSGEAAIVFSVVSSESYGGLSLNVYSSDTDYSSGTYLFDINIELNVSDTSSYVFDGNKYYSFRFEPPIDSIRSYSFLLGEYPFSHVEISEPVIIGKIDAQPDKSAILDLSSTSKGFLPPRMTKQQIYDILGPEEGLQVFSLTDKKPLYFDGEEWRDYSGTKYFYDIGDYAEGGMVFYLDGLTGLAFDTSFTNNPVLAEWGCMGTNLVPLNNNSNDYYIGYGLANTVNIVDSCSTIGIAAEIALNNSIVVEGITYDDWFLPSKNEAREVKHVTPTFNGVFEFPPAFSFWNSNERNPEETTANTFNTVTLYVSYLNKDNQSTYVLPIRAF